MQANGSVLCKGLLVQVSHSAHLLSADRWLYSTCTCTSTVQALVPTYIVGSIVVITALRPTRPTTIFNGRLLYLLDITTANIWWWVSPDARHVIISVCVFRIKYINSQNGTPVQQWVAIERTTTTCSFCVLCTAIHPALTHAINKWIYLVQLCFVRGSNRYKYCAEVLFAMKQKLKHMPHIVARYVICKRGKSDSEWHVAVLIKSDNEYANHDLSWEHVRGIILMRSNT